MWRFYRNYLAVFGVLSVYPIGQAMKMVILMVASGSFLIPESVDIASLMLIPFALFFRYLFTPFDEMLMQNIYRSSFWAFMSTVLLLIFINTFSAFFTYDGFTIGCMVALPLGIALFCVLPFAYDLKDAHNARSDN